MPAVVSSTATSIIVFLPLVLGGRTEITTWIGEVGRTIIFTLICSLLLSLTLIPLAMGRFLRAGVGKPTRVIVRLSELHQRVLRWTLRHRPATVGISVGLFAVAIVLFGKVDKSTFAGTQVEAVAIDYEFADNLNYLEVEKYVTRVERWIQDRKDSLHVKSTYSYSGAPSITRAYLSGLADTRAPTSCARRCARSVPARSSCGSTRRRLGRRGCCVRSSASPSAARSGRAEVERRLRPIPGLEDVEIGGERGRQEVEVVVDRDRAFQYGLNTAGVGASVARFFRGRPLARFRGPDGEVEVQARLAEADRSSLDGLEAMPVLTSGGASVPLGAVADFRTVPRRVGQRQHRARVTVGCFSTRK